MDLHEQLALQREQETQMTTELEMLLNRFAEEYAVTKHQIAAMLEEQKLRALGFLQPSEELLELLDDLRFR